MYLIAKGEVQIIIGESEDGEIKQNKKNKQSNTKTLRPGAYFGEISLCYDCLCTAKVVATKYCTLAMLTKEQFKVVTT